MEPMYVTDDLFKKKRKLEEFLDDLFYMELTDSSDVGIKQSRHNGASSKVKLMIHHQCPGIELVSSLYYSDGEAYYIPRAQRIDFGTTVQAGFNIDLSRSEFICALMYEIKRKNTNEFNEATCTQLVMIWKVDKFKKIRLIQRLIEHDKGRVWDRDKLMELTNRYESYDIQHDSIEETWLMRDYTVLMIGVNVTRGAWYELEMTISETSIKDNTQRPQYIDVDR
jgi:hypothetical protein